MKPISKQLILSTYLLFLVFLLPNISRGEEEAGRAGLSVEPAISKISVAPASQLKSGFTVRNTGEEKIAFSIRVIDFLPEDEFGGIREIEGESTIDDPIRASGWVSVPLERITLPANHKIVIPYSITVPKEASPGGRSFAFVIESLGGNVHTRLNTLSFLTVSGDASEILNLEDFSFSPIISGKAKGYLHVELKNDGKTHVSPEGRITIRNMFGAVRGIFTLDQNNSLGIIIPTAKRSTDYSWEGSLNAFDFGLWNAKIELNYGTNGEHYVSERTFFGVLPWKAIILTIIILGGACIIFVRSISKLRKKIVDLNIDVNERFVSIKLLIIPLATGMLLLIVAITSIYSVIEYRETGTLVKIDLSKK